MTQPTLRGRLFYLGLVLAFHAVIAAVSHQWWFVAVGFAMFVAVDRARCHEVAVAHAFTRWPWVVSILYGLVVWLFLFWRVFFDGGGLIYGVGMGLYFAVAYRLRQGPRLADRVAVRRHS